LHALVVSDLHLDAALPAIGRQFVSFLDGEAREAVALYVLGDLFETWIGDDDTEPHRQTVIAALRRLTDAGTELYVMAGNRDFLYGRDFEAATGAVLLTDPTLVTRFGQSVLMTHGDALCVDDVPYQRLRAMVRDADWQRAFLALPRSAREHLAEVARSGSRQHTATQMTALMDVNADAVTAVFRTADVDTILHGHTHRPAVHHLVIDGRRRTRIVTGDWCREGSVVRWDDSGFTLESRPRDESCGSLSASPYVMHP
jgi:UDP-2,3-diacylglucosamine hydrolase